MIDSRVEERSFWEMVKACSGTAADRRNQYRFLVWAALWAAAFVGGTWVLDRGRVPAGAAAWLVAVAPLLPGVLAFRAYLRFVRMADELVQKIQFESLAFGFGCGAIAGLGYPLLERAGAPAFPELVLLAMMFGWAGRQAWAVNHYR